MLRLSTRVLTCPGAVKLSATISDMIDSMLGPARVSNLPAIHPGVRYRVAGKGVVVVLLRVLGQT
jgi:hypothetical protein